MTLKLPDIPNSEQTPLVKGLLTIIEQLVDQNQKLKEEVSILKDDIRVLKGEKKRPKFKPSKLEQKTNDETKKKCKKKPRANKKDLTIHVEKKIKPDNIPEGSRFKGYQNFTIQDLVIEPKNTRYRLERWLTPDGKILTGALPKSLEHRHYGSNIVTYLLYQHHHCQVTQPLLLEQLKEWGIVISSGQLDRLLTVNKERFHNEKDDLLKVGLAESSYVTVDDSGARHKGKNGYVTHIGNDFFAWFSSTDKKSRANFLSLLQSKKTTYFLCEDAFEYMLTRQLPPFQIEKLKVLTELEYSDKDSWEELLESIGITSIRHVRSATEGALMGALLKDNNLEHLAIISDGAGQFNILQHGLCWVHAERLIHTMIPLNEKHREDIKTIRGKIWDLYKELKQYKLSPEKREATRLSEQFDDIFSQKTSYEILNQCLRRLGKLKEKLLLVLRRPDVPLHTNGSESDIRDYVKKRKVSGGTRSDLGQKCRDTFISLKKTCRKLNISFWEYLSDRHNEQKIPLLSEKVKIRLTSLNTATGL